MMYNVLTILFLFVLTPAISAYTLPHLPFFGQSNDDQKPIHPPPARPPGIHIPPLGLGLWNSKDSSATHAVTAAFSTGYTHIDSAAAYSNEAYVGAAITNLTLHRSQYWVTSKLWNTAHQPHLVRPALEQTLKDLQTPYLDLYLMHWPVAFLPNQPSGRTIIDQDTTVQATWKAMEELVAANLTRYVGISNFSPRQIDALLCKATIRPFAHEFETHPYLQQQTFVNWHHREDVDIKVIAYSPLANLNPTYNGTHKNIAPILEDPFWIELAKNKSVSVPQAVLAWGIQRGTVVIPKSVHRSRIEENWGAWNGGGEKRVTFDNEEMARIAEQDRRARFNNPSKDWGVELFEGLDDGSDRFVELQEGSLEEEL